MKEAWIRLALGAIVVVALITWIVGHPSLAIAEKIFAIMFSIYIFLPGLLGNYIFLSINPTPNYRINSDRNNSDFKRR